MKGSSALSKKVAFSVQNEFRKTSVTANPAGPTTSLILLDVEDEVEVDVEVLVLVEVLVEADPVGPVDPEVSLLVEGAVSPLEYDVEEESVTPEEGSEGP